MERRFLYGQPRQYEFPAHNGGSQKWSGKFGQFDKWIFPPERGVIAADRREENDQTGTPDTRSGIQGEGGDSGDQR
jgi:hypothetical protein